MHPPLKRSRTPLRIANASGYWGDDPFALRRLLAGSLELHYVTADFLAELSMSILEKQRLEDSTKGYAADFVRQVEPLLGELVAKKITLITNAGGVNPRACAEALLASAKKKEIPLTIAIVEGDSLMARLQELSSHLAHMNTGETLKPRLGKVRAANVYLGGLAIARALRSKPDIVITGRVTDSGLALGAMMHEFQWQHTEYDTLAAGVVAGHLIECGAQVCGGNFTDWRSVGSFAQIGFPIAEVEPDGSFTITKQPESGGSISLGTVREQLLYEIGDPRAYVTPDVVADFTTLTLTQVAQDRVRVEGVTGMPPPATLKASIALEDGYRCSGALLISGPEARAKAECFSALLWESVTRELRTLQLSPIEHILTEYIGDDAFHRGIARTTRKKGGEADEIYLRFGARDRDKRKLDLVRKLIPSLILSGPPGVAVTGGSPPVSEVMKFWPALVPLAEIHPTITQLTNQKSTTPKAEVLVLPQPPPRVEAVTQDAAQSVQVPTLKRGRGAKKVSVPLIQIAHARSGDKGDIANIALIARSPECFEWLRENITVPVVTEWFADFTKGTVERFEAPNLCALNFLLHDALDGGGTTSLRLDSQGKTLGQALLRCVVKVPENVLASIASVPTEEKV